MLKGFVHPDFSAAASGLYRQISRTNGGAAFCVYHHGEKVVDIWGGKRDSKGNLWEEDTVSVSYSTTKGVVSTLLHILIDRGDAFLDDPIALHWPEFSCKGKENITIRHAMCHEAGLYHIRTMVEDFSEIYDWERMINTLAKSTPVHVPGKAHGYHGLTYGWLIGGIIEAITKKSLTQVLIEELVEPLGLKGCFIGLPEEHFHRRAELLSSFDPPNLSIAAQGALKTVGNLVKLLSFDYEQFMAALIPPSVDAVDWNSKEYITAILPAMNGMFTARSLATIYAMIAAGGQFEGKQILSTQHVQNMGQRQNTTRDRVLFLPMHWRLGYHRVFAVGAKAPFAFGHFGLGGSGAWCDPSRNLSVALTVNSGIGTPMGDARIAFLSGSVLRCADLRDERLRQEAS